MPAKTTQPTKKGTAKMATTEATASAKSVDVSAWSVNAKREAPKRKIIKEGMDRTPVYALLERLKPEQVVELPVMDRKAATSTENLIREAAKDKGLSITFLVDSERNAANGKLPEGHSHYVWFVKGPYKPRGPRKTESK